MSKLINFSEKERVKGHTRRGQRVNPFTRQKENSKRKNQEFDYESTLNSLKISSAEETGRSIGTIGAGSLVIGGLAYSGRRSLKKNPEAITSLNNVVEKHLSTIRKGAPSRVEGVQLQIRNNLERSLKGQTITGPSTQKLGKTLNKLNRRQNLTRGVYKLPAYTAKGIANSMASPIGPAALTIGVLSAGALGASILGRIERKKQLSKKQKKK